MGRVALGEGDPVRVAQVSRTGGVRDGASRWTGSEHSAATQSRSRARAAELEPARTGRDDDQTRTGPLGALDRTFQHRRNPHQGAQVRASARGPPDIPLRWFYDP